jgi:hypothetical protein
MRTRVNVLLIGWMTSSALVSAAPPPQPTFGRPEVRADETRADTIKRIAGYLKTRYLEECRPQAAAAFGTDVGASTAFEQQGQNDRAPTLTLGGAGKPHGFNFPLTAKFDPFYWPTASTASSATAESALRATLLDSSLTVQANGILIPKSGWKGSLTYQVPLPVGKPGSCQSTAATVERRVDQELQQRADLGTAAVTDAEKMNQLIVVAAAVTDKEASRPSLSATVGYGWDARPNMPNSKSAQLIAEKPFGGTVGPDATGQGIVPKLIGTIGATGYDRVSPTISFSKLTGSLDLQAKLDSYLLTLTPTWDRYSGSGFATFLHFSDRTRRDDLTLKAAFAVSVDLPWTDQFAFAVSEEHLGTAERDTAFTFTLKLDLVRSGALAGMP